MIVIADTTPIITFLKLQRLNLLHQLFDVVNIPSAVYSELVSNSNFADEANIIRQCHFLKPVDVVNKQSIKLLQQIIGLDAGESEAIALADEQHADLLIIDEHKGRNVAKKLGINITGSIGIILHAYDEGLLSKDDVIDCIGTLQKSNIRISNSLIDIIFQHLK